MAVFNGFQTDSYATWVGMVDAFNVYERHIWTAFREPLSPGLTDARSEIQDLIRRSTMATPDSRLSQPNATIRGGPFVRIDGVTTTTAANTLGVSQAYVRRLCLEGRLGAEKVRGSWKIDPVDVAIRAQRSGRQ